ncbi:MAG: hydroxymethylglutaryl-CoA synthase [Kiritimatiellia bacterium]
MPAGIERISFYTPHYMLPLQDLAAARGADYDKYRVGIGQEIMAVAPPDEDIVTMAASAALPLARFFPTVEMVLFATESGIDQSKAAGMFVHGLLGLPHRCRVIEFKQACYSATLALRFAVQTVNANPKARVLVLASDIARYELGSPAEPTQGAGAVAMLISANPDILTLDPESGLHAEDVMDFWRPNYREEAVVEGKTSTRVYLHALQKTWEHYHAQTGRMLADFDYCCFHTPFTNMAAKAYQTLCKQQPDHHQNTNEDFERKVAPSLFYNRITGNTYSASLYECLACLLDQSSQDLANAKISFYSYGSGCTAEFFSGKVTPGYQAHLQTAQHRALLEARTPLTVRQYEDVFKLALPRDGWNHRFGQYSTGAFRFAGVNGHKRIYEQTR